MALDDDIRLFEQVPIFRLLEPDALRLLAFSAETKLLRAGDVLFAAPARLEGGYLGGDDDREAGDLDLDIDAPKRRPTMLVIVEPGVAFVEQVPRTTETIAKSEAESEAD